MNKKGTTGFSLHHGYDKFVFFFSFFSNQMISK